MIQIRNRGGGELRLATPIVACLALIVAIILSLSISVLIARQAEAATKSSDKASTTSKTSEEAAVAARSEARMEKMIARDTKAVYGFLPPATRKSMSYKQYMNSHQLWMKVKRAKVAKVQCVSHTSCRVEMQWTFDDNPGGRGVNVGEVTAVFPERWIKVHGQWWYYLK